MHPSSPCPPRVLVLAPGEVFGGAERQILTLLSSVREQLPHLKLVVFHDAELAAHARAMGLDVEALGVRGLWDPQALRHLINILDAEQTQIVHIHGYRATVYAALAHRKHPFASIKTEHGAVETNGFLSARSVRSHLYRFIENQAARRLKADLVYVTRDLQRRCAGEHRNMSGHVIHNGIGALPESIEDAPHEFHPGYRHVVAIGRLEPVKGMDIAIRAMATGSVPSNVILHIIGTGPMESSLVRLIRDLGLDNKVHLLGFRNNVYSYIAHANALLIPSLHEGLPYTLLEALALKTPVIAADVGGLSEVLVDRESALLIPPRNPHKLAAAIQTLLNDPILTAAFREKGRSLAMNQFSATRMGESYLKLFALAAARLS